MGNTKDGGRLSGTCRFFRSFRPLRFLFVLPGAAVHCLLATLLTPGYILSDLWPSFRKVREETLSCLRNVELLVAETQKRRNRNWVPPGSLLCGGDYCSMENGAVHWWVPNLMVSSMASPASASANLSLLGSSNLFSPGASRSILE